MVEKKSKSTTIYYHGLTRWRLQRLGKKHGIPANKSSVFIADSLTKLLNGEEFTLSSHLQAGVDKCNVERSEFSWNVKSQAQLSDVVDCENAKSHIFPPTRSTRAHRDKQLMPKLEKKPEEFGLVRIKEEVVEGWAPLKFPSLSLPRGPLKKPDDRSEQPRVHTEPMEEFLGWEDTFKVGKGSPLRHNTAACDIIAAMELDDAAKNSVTSTSVKSIGFTSYLEPVAEEEAVEAFEEKAYARDSCIRPHITLPEDKRSIPKSQSVDEEYGLPKNNQGFLSNSFLQAGPKAHHPDYDAKARVGSESKASLLFSKESTNIEFESLPLKKLSSSVCEKGCVAPEADFSPFPKRTIRSDKSCLPPAVARPGNFEYHVEREDGISLLVDLNQKFTPVEEQFHYLQLLESKGSTSPDIKELTRNDPKELKTSNFAGIDIHMASSIQVE